VALCGFALCFIIHHSSFCLPPAWLCQAVRWWKSDVGCWLLGARHKYSKYTPPLPPRSGWSGGTLVPPWYLPIPIDSPQTPIFNQASLSKSLSCGFSAVKRCSGLDVEGWVLDVPPRQPGLSLSNSPVRTSRPAWQTRRLPCYLVPKAVRRRFRQPLNQPF
jgi:hypothetical protein